jgi:hypothetical protein
MFFFCGLNLLFNLKLINQALFPVPEPGPGRL